MSKPTENVLIGAGSPRSRRSRSISATTMLLSTPPESCTPSGTSDMSCMSIVRARRVSSSAAASSSSIGDKRYRTSQ
jgi:hypothetical protein